MTESTHVRHRLIAAVAAGCAGLALANSAGAVDLRDWGRKMSPENRFVVLSQFGNQAVLDMETQLVWQRSPSKVFVTYQTAWDTCDVATTGARMGWRLPTLSELRTLSDTTIADQYVPSLPAGHPFIGIMAPLGAGPTGNNYGRYWTTTLPITLDPTSRLVVTIGRQYPTVHPVTAALSAAWCVRGVE